MTNDVMLVLLLSTVIPLCGLFEMVQLVIWTEPVMLVITMPSCAAVPAESVMFMRFKAGSAVLV